MADSVRNKRSKIVKIQMIAVFSLLILLITMFVIIVFSARMGSSMKKQMADMLEHLNDQITTNADNTMKSIQDNVSALWNDDLILKTTTADIDEADLEQLNSDLERYRILPSYADFGICYDDGSVAGLIGDDTRIAAGSDIYGYFKYFYGNSAAVWSTQPLPDRSRLFYIKQVNSDSVFVASIPVTVITESFENSVFISGMTSYLTDGSLVIQCSNDEEMSPGSYLRTNIYSLVDRSGGSSVGDSYVIATSRLDNGWYVVTAVPNRSILSTLSSTVIYVICTSAVVFIIGVICIVFFSGKFSDVMEATVDKLDIKAQTDLLTGLINKRSFEEIVENTLSAPENGMQYAMVFMDIDNFKHVNDRCGHDIGDEVLRSFSHTIGTVFRETDIKGRLGGDEFCVLMKMPASENINSLDAVNDACRRFKEALYKKSTSARQSLPAVTSSMGASIWEGVPEGFEEMYHKADTALYASKKAGKNTWSVYGQGNVNDSILEEKVSQTDSDR